MRVAAVVIFALMALAGFGIGRRYFSARTLMPYQLSVAGKSWEHFSPGERVVFGAMMRVVGGGFFSLGAAMAWAAYGAWAGISATPWAALSIGFAGLIPALSATLLIRGFQPHARPPLALTPGSPRREPQRVGTGVSPR